MGSAVAGQLADGDSGAVRAPGVGAEYLIDHLLPRPQVRVADDDIGTDEIRALLEETRRHRDELSAIVTQLHQHLEAAQVERSELRRLLSQAQSLIAALVPPLSPAAQAPSIAEHLPSSMVAEARQAPNGHAPAVEQAPRRPWWQFWH